MVDLMAKAQRHGLPMEVSTWEDGRTANGMVKAR